MYPLSLDPDDLLSLFHALHWHLGLAGTSFYVPEGAAAPYRMVGAVGSTVTFE